MPVKPDPTSIKAFTGAAGFYRAWIADFAKIITPLNELLKKGVDVPTVWAANPTRYEHAVKQLKLALTSYPILRQPDFSLEFKLYTCLK